MKYVTFMEMVDLSYSDEYREYVANKAFDAKRRNESIVDMLVEDLAVFDQFLDDFGYRLTV